LVDFLASCSRAHLPQRTYDGGGGGGGGTSRHGSRVSFETVAFGVGYKTVYKAGDSLQHQSQQHEGRSDENVLLPASGKGPLLGVRTWSGKGKGAEL